jgi:hypothetical protein
MSVTNLSHKNTPLSAFGTIAFEKKPPKPTKMRCCEDFLAKLWEKNEFPFTYLNQREPSKLFRFGLGQNFPGCFSRFP